LIDFNGSKQGAFLYAYLVTSNLFLYPTAESGIKAEKGMGHGKLMLETIINPL
jgi:hypothetical protein